MFQYGLGNYCSSTLIKYLLNINEKLTITPILTLKTKVSDRWVPIESPNPPARQHHNIHVIKSPESQTIIQDGHMIEAAGKEKAKRY